MAYGAYVAHVEYQGSRVFAAFVGEKSKDASFAKVRIAEATSDIDAAVASADRQFLLRVKCYCSSARRLPSSCVPVYTLPGTWYWPGDRLDRQAVRGLRGFPTVQ
ncbi:hypothetical protein ABFA25_05745 [Mycobacterium lepromatosis]|nr:hypothetical protein [Mycobacterium lepromatosis]